MDSQTYRELGKHLIDYTAQYHEEIEDRLVVANVQPGYLRQLLPSAAPEEAESWRQVMHDFEKCIMPGITHWQHPNNHAYFQTAHSFAATCADILSDSIGSLGFSWASCPVYTELEVIVLDWLVPLLGLPDTFLSTSKGGGVINTAASEVTLTMLFAARSRMIEIKTKEDPNLDKYQISGRLVGYYSEEAHSSVERAGLIAMIRMQAIPTDEDHSMRSYALEEAIKEDLQLGFWPFFVCATLGSTNSCAFDPLDKIGPVCKTYNLWLHTDAAYAGSFFICPEFRHYLKGIEFVDSFNFNPHKGLLVNFDCSVVWLTNRRHLISSFEVNPLYLQSEVESEMPEYRHWHIPLGRRFRSLKIWFVLRLHGVKGLQEIIRNKVYCATKFSEMIETDGRFEIVEKLRLDLVCFRVKSDNERTEALLQKIREDKRINLVPGKFPGVFFLRVVCNSVVTLEHMHKTFNVIKELMDGVR